MKCSVLKPILSLPEPPQLRAQTREGLRPNIPHCHETRAVTIRVRVRLASHGILEEIRTAMMPTQTAIEAQLYKLNVYGPSGHFKSHVDTPRGGAMFGSLVVCLPVGRKLVVVQDQESIIFDWGRDMRDAERISHESGESNRPASPEVSIKHSGEDAAASQPDDDGNIDRGIIRPEDKRAAIRWAAFYSDCEHSIEPVLSGHRLTLTYNRYATSKIGDVRLSAISPTTFPIYKKLETLRSVSHFMPEAGRHGFGCQYVYPHTSRGFVKIIESMLKGADLAIFHCNRKWA